MDIDIVVKDDLLKQLVKNLSKEITVDVGIFDNEVANYAMKLEFGANDVYVPELDRKVDIPARSFLQVPIEENLQKELHLTEDDLLNENSQIDKKIGEETKNIVEVTLHNEGYGKWVENSPEWKSYKAEHGYDTRILHKTGKLQESIEYRIK